VDRLGAFVAAADEHEHEIRGVRIERGVVDFVDDRQRDALQLVEPRIAVCA